MSSSNFKRVGGTYFNDTARHDDAELRAESDRDGSESSAFQSSYSQNDLYQSEIFFAPKHSNSSKLPYNLSSSSGILLIST
jgi:hypothetical protein